MNYLPLFLVYNPPHETIGEKLSLSGEMLLRGLGTVFLVLAILWGVIELFNFISTSGERSTEKKKKEEAKPVSPAEEPKAAPTVEVKPEAVPDAIPAEEEIPAEDDGAVIAAIIAAIEAYRQEEGTYSLPYRVVSFKRKNTKNSRG